MQLGSCLRLGWLALVFSVVGAAKAWAEVPKPEDIRDPSAEVLENVGELEFRQCRIRAQGRERKVQCAWYPVPENPADADGKTIDLFVVRLPAKRSSTKIQDPVLFIAGGPGQAASESYLYADYQWPALAVNRDFYLIDQRGTGYSNRLGCDEIRERYAGLETETDLSVIRQAARDCVALLDADVRFYNTDTTVQDFETLRQAMGIEIWNLLGVSYGTRVATHYMRRNPESVRSVVLDSVLAPSEVLGLNIAHLSQAMLDVLIERCQQDVMCHKRMPNLKFEIDQLFQRLNESPVNIRVENFTSGDIEDVEFTSEMLATLVRMYLYSSSTAALLPPMLHEAAVKNNFSPLARAAQAVNDSLEDAISTGLHNSVVCTEDAPYLNEYPDTLSKLNRDSYFRFDFVEFLQATCSVWPVGENKLSREPLQSNIPTLLVSGEYDPITPPAYAEKTARELSHATQLVLKGQGHFVSVTGCMPDLIEIFINDKSTENIDTQCLDRISADPVFINFNTASP